MKLCLWTNFFYSETKLHKFAFVVSKEKLNKGLCNGVKLDVYFPGFPTLKHIEHTVSLLQIYCVFLLHWKQLTTRV